jgi:hypothetical protein
VANKSNTILSDESIHILDEISNEAKIFVAYEPQTEADDEMFAQPMKTFNKNFSPIVKKLLKLHSLM